MSYEICLQKQHLTIWGSLLMIAKLQKVKKLERVDRRGHCFCLEFRGEILCYKF